MRGTPVLHSAGIVPFVAWRFLRKSWQLHQSLRQTMGWVKRSIFSKSFGIHGLWPSYDSADLTCVMNGKNPDPFCDYKYYFNGNLLKTLEKSL